MATRRASSSAARARTGSGVLRMALAFALLLAGLALVVRRQSRALELVRAVEKARAERTLAEAERAELRGRIERLQARAHVAEAASRRGMRLPSGNEIVILSEPSAKDGPGGAPARPAMALR